ncbi:MAG: hypothetical protein FWC51_02280 [Proteobacteria bacterium]|nr:hypothetical protein [Pseudomonadota bacterium]
MDTDDDFIIESFSDGDFTDGFLTIELYRLEPILNYLDDRLAPVTDDFSESNARVAMNGIHGNQSLHAIRKNAAAGQKKLKWRADQINVERWAFQNYKKQCEKLRMENTAAANAYDRAYE